MSQKHSSRTTAVNVSPFDADDVFMALADPFRLQIIRSLARGETKIAMDLGAGSGKTRPAYKKDIRALCKAGILVKDVNKEDRRQPLFALSPHAIVLKSDDGVSLDFGCGMLRF